MLFITLCAIIIIDLMFFVIGVVFWLPSFTVVEIKLFYPDLVSRAYDLSDIRFTDAVHNRCKYCSQDENLITSFNKLKEYYNSEYYKRYGYTYNDIKDLEDQENFEKLFNEFFKKK